ncbi:helix-turn-helix domain-containing protein [Dysgonomonas sp. 520]|uniref:helix-turn-helix domain-containing protein n=1 Tax=Dysgonomonas sp. 520 TaxID=2302931 RepID=UPI0013D0E716|nr:helix-turn-helix domain-containing protein [Dysgonomonas sp. 520]MDL2302795.1 helix-turn-helix domain-containing protein [Dysgonomonas sp. OttesenSCG-928-D17]NDW10204.1 DNA-binding protein [Dysgonomonas sp. 520]
MRIDDDIFESNIRGLARLLKNLDAKIDKLLVADSSVMDERLFDNQDLCLFLKVTPRTLQRYRNQGLIPFKTICKRNYYKESDVNIFVNKYFGGKTQPTDKDKYKRKNKRCDDDTEDVVV